MPRTAAPISTAVTASAEGRPTSTTDNGNGNGQNEAEENRSAFKGGIERIETIKTNLRDILGDLSDAVSMLKAAERQQRGASREVEAIRAKLREIQSVRI